MKSVRFDRELEACLARAACSQGISGLSFVPEVVRSRRDEVLKSSLAEDLEKLGVIGAVDLGGVSARDAGKRFTEILSAPRER